MKVKTFNRIKIILFPLVLVWTLPQILLGFFIWLFSYIAKPHYMKRHKDKDGLIWYGTKKPNKVYGVSLGLFIFLYDDLYGDDFITHHHEFGHQIQSLILGWLYLLVIGIPSSFANVKWLSKIFYKRETHTYKEYYHGIWCERWADKLGGVIHTFEDGFNRELKEKV